MWIFFGAQICPIRQTGQEKLIDFTVGKESFVSILIYLLFKKKINGCVNIFLVYILS